MRAFRYCDLHKSAEIFNRTVQHLSIVHRNCNNRLYRGRAEFKNRTTTTNTVHKIQIKAKRQIEPKALDEESIEYVVLLCVRACESMWCNRADVYYFLYRIFINQWFRGLWDSVESLNLTLALLGDCIHWRTRSAHSPRMENDFIFPLIRFLSSRMRVSFSIHSTLIDHIFSCSSTSIFRLIWAIDKEVRSALSGRRMRLFFLCNSKHFRSIFHFPSIDRLIHFFVKWAALFNFSVDCVPGGI